MDSNPLLDPEQFQEWKDQRLTKAFLSYLDLCRSNLMQQWAVGTFSHNPALSEAAQARAALLSQLLDLSPDDVAQTYGVDNDRA